MTTYRGQQNAKPGLYLNLKNFTIAHVEARGPLPGADAVRYVRVPMLLMLAAAPLAGLAFVIFLPLIGFVMAARLLGDRLWQGIVRAITGAVRVVRPSWVPALAFLSRSKPAAPDATSSHTPDAWKEHVEKTMDAADRHER